MCQEDAPNSSPVDSLADMEVYDPETNTWEKLPDMPTARSGLGATAMNGKIYVFGGELPITFEENEVYDIATRTWETLEPLPIPVHGIGVVTFGNGIFLFGGGPEVGRAAAIPDGFFYYPPSQ